MQAWGKDQKVGLVSERSIDDVSGIEYEPRFRLSFRGSYHVFFFCLELIS
jgi:hypothetical protein